MIQVSLPFHSTRNDDTESKNCFFVLDFFAGFLFNKKNTHFHSAENERSKLDPLPEERTAISTTTPVNAATTPPNEPYKRVYPDWRPSVSADRTEPSFDDTDPSRSLSDDQPSKYDKLRNSTSSTSISSLAAPLQSIVEEERRNGDNIVKINVPADYEPVYQKHTSQKPHASSLAAEAQSMHGRPAAAAVKADSPASRSSHSFDLDTDTGTNKIEIDSDNIETPPVARKHLAPPLDDKSTAVAGSKKLQAPRPLHQRTIDEASAKEAADSQPIQDAEALGHFDRHSSARRTRRYRRPTDHSSGNDERHDTTPESASPTNQNYPKYGALDGDDPKPKAVDSDAGGQSKPIDILSRIGRHGRNMSSINQEAVREAIRKLKSPTETPERIWSPPRDIVAAAPKLLAAKVATNHELNDEGFEETQSLVSDTPSHGKESSSSCNEPADAKHQSPTRRGLSTAAGDAAKPKPSVKTLLERNRESLARSRSLRAGSSAVTGTHARNATAPIRTHSLRARTMDSGSGGRAMDVERSGSRTSLRSSRSSLNSAASTHTVRNMAAKSVASAAAGRHVAGGGGGGGGAEKAGVRKKLTQSTAAQKSLSNGGYAYLRAPASRSSSSGSSIGASSRQTKTTSSSNSATPPISPQRPAFRTAVSSNSVLHQPQPTARATAKMASVKGIAAKTTSRVSSFMRPTTSSATKVTTSRGK